MCGISGIYYPQKREIDKSKLEKMASLQNHRGPDFTGFYYDNCIGLAHNRLSLLDLSANGNQPFFNDEYVLVYNGEIYNFKELKKELEDFQSKSSSDTEVLFQCLLQWGVEKTLSKIQGMFAFIWYNKNKNEVYLCRDRFAIKPIYIGFLKDGGFCFASELKGLTLNWDFEVDSIQVLFSTLGTLEKSNWNTAWKDVKIVPAGSFMLLNSNGWQTKEYFSISDYVDEYEYRRLDKSNWDEVVSEFDLLLDHSVQKMLVSDAPMGAYVSGGIDSSMIAHFAENQQKQNFKLFTANVIGKHSEFSDAQTLSKHIGSPLFSYDFEKEMIFRDWARVTYHYESPLVTHFNSIPFSNVSMLAHEHEVKAVLTGEGSDELFLGYPRLLTKRYDSLLRSPFSLLNWIYSRNPKLANYVDYSRGSGGLLGVFELGSQGFRRQIVKDSQLSSYGFLEKDAQSEHYLTAQMMQEGIKTLLWRNDRMGMIYNIESRFPFLDESMVSFGMNLPVKFKIGRTNKFYNYKHPFLMDKAIVRKSAEKKLPNSLVYKKKNGFPLHGLREVKVKPQFLYDSVFADLFSFSNNQIDYLVKSQSRYHVALIASFEIWAKLFLKKESVQQVDQAIQGNLSF